MCRGAGADRRDRRRYEYAKPTRQQPGLRAARHKETWQPAGAISFNFPRCLWGRMSGPGFPNVDHASGEADVGAPARSVSHHPMTYPTPMNRTSRRNGSCAATSGRHNRDIDEQPRRPRTT